MDVDQLLRQLGVLVVLLLVGCPDVLAKGESVDKDFRRRNNRFEGAREARLPKQVVGLHFVDNLAEELGRETVDHQVPVVKQTQALGHKRRKLLDADQLIDTKHFFVH